MPHSVHSLWWWVNSRVLALCRPLLARKIRRCANVLAVGMGEPLEVQEERDRGELKRKKKRRKKCEHHFFRFFFLSFHNHGRARIFYPFFVPPDLSWSLCPFKSQPIELADQRTDWYSKDGIHSLSLFFFFSQTSLSTQALFHGSQHPTTILSLDKVYH